MESRKDINIHITYGTIIKVTLALLVIWVAYLISDILLLVLLSLILASAIEPAKKTLARIKIPPAISVLVVYLVFFLIIILFITLFVPIIAKESQAFFEILPTLTQRVEDFLNSSFIVNFLGSVDLSSFNTEIAQFSSVFVDSFISGTSKIFGGIFSFLLVLLLTFFFSVKQEGVTSFIRLITPTIYKDYSVDLWSRSKKKIGLWIQGQLLLAAVIGVLVYFTLVVLGVPNALFLALFAAFMELIPLIGPVLSAIPAILVALVETDLFTAGIVLVAFIAIQQFENHLIYPLIVTKVVGVPAILVVLSIVIGAILAGFIGVVIAIPFTAALIEFFNDLESGKLKKISQSA